jgi:hypothetical protein
MSKSTSVNDDKVWLADGYEDCIIGLGWQFNQPLVVYSKNKIIAKLANEFAAHAFDNKEFDANDAYRGDRDFFAEAEEYFSFNIVGSWMGKGTPVYVDEDVNNLDAINEEVGDYNV